MNIFKIIVTAASVVSCVYSADKSDAPALEGKEELTAQIIACAKAFYAYNKVEHGEGATIDDLIIQYQNFEDARPFAYKIQMLGLMLAGVSFPPIRLKNMYGIDVTQFYDDLKSERDWMQSGEAIGSETLRVLFNKGSDLIVRIEAMLGLEITFADTDFGRYVINFIKKPFMQAQDYYKVTLTPIRDEFKTFLKKPYQDKPKVMDIIDEVVDWVYAFHIHKTYCDIVHLVMARMRSSLLLADARARCERDVMFVTICSGWHKNLMELGFTSELIDAVMSKVICLKDGVTLASCGLFLPSSSPLKSIFEKRKELVAALKKNTVLPNASGEYTFSEEVIELAGIYLKSYFNQELSKMVSVENDARLKPLLAGFDLRGSSGGGSAGAGGSGRPQKERFVLIPADEELAFETETVAGVKGARAGGSAKPKGGRRASKK